MILRVRVTANCRKEGIFLREGVVHVKVCAPAIEGKANRKVLDALAKKLGFRCALAGGERSRDKSVDFHGVSEEEMGRALAKLEKA